MTTTYAIYDEPPTTLDDQPTPQETHASYADARLSARALADCYQAQGWVLLPCYHPDLLVVQSADPDLVANQRCILIATLTQAR